MSFACKADNGWREITDFYRQKTGDRDDDFVTVSIETLDSMNVEELRSIGIKKIVEPSEPPENSRIVGNRLTDVNNTPVREWVFQPYTSLEAYNIMWQRAKEITANYVEGTAQVTINNKPYYTDVGSFARQFLLGYVQLAVIAKTNNVEYNETWTMDDNTNVTLDVDGMINLGSQVARYISNVYANTRAIRKSLDAAIASQASAGTIFLIDIESGYAPAGWAGTADPS